MDARQHGDIGLGTRATRASARTLGKSICAQIGLSAWVSRRKGLKYPESPRSMRIPKALSGEQ